jgi:hypothetical protein
MATSQTHSKVPPHLGVTYSCTSQSTATSTPPIRTTEASPRLTARQQCARERVVHLFPAPEPEAKIHARELIRLALLRKPKAAGAWVSARDLERLYREHNKAQGLHRLSWVLISRHLKSMVAKRQMKRGGKRRVYYRLPYRAP